MLKRQSTAALQNVPSLPALVSRFVFWSGAVAPL
jgi:hypothetical protein